MKKTTRIASLVLVLLMLVGMMPLALFAGETDTNAGTCVALPTAEQRNEAGVTNKITTDFNSFSLGNLANNTTPVNSLKIVNDAEAVEVIADGEDNKVIRFGDGSTSGKAYLDAEMKNSGRNFVFQIDVKLETDFTATSLIKARVRAASNKSNREVNLVTLGWDGSLTDVDGNPVGAVNKDAFTTVGVKVDLYNNKYWVYINGVCQNADGVTFINDELKATLQADLGSASTFDVKKCWLETVRVLQSTNNTNTLLAGKSLLLDNVAFYFTKADSNGNAVDGITYIGEVFNDDVVITNRIDTDFNDFTLGNLGHDTYPVTNLNIINNAEAVKVIADGDNQFIRFGDGTATPASGKTVKAHLEAKMNASGGYGRNFVFQIDVKLETDFTKTSLIKAMVRATTASIQEVNLVTLNWDGSLTDVDGNVVGTVSRTEFTKVAAKVDLYSNKYWVYVDGVCQNVDGATFIKDSLKNTFQAELNAGTGVNKDKFGFGQGDTYDVKKCWLESIRVLQTVSAKDAKLLEGKSVLLDNLKFYFTEADRNGNAVNGITYLDAKNGFEKDGDMGHYYEDGILFGVDTEGYTLGMEGKIELNYFLSSNFVPQAKTYVEFTVKDDVTSVAFDTLTKGEYGYKVTVSIPAAEMTETIKAVVKYEDGTVLCTLADYSAVQYAADILAGDEYSNNAKAAVKAMVNYATEAQKQFNRNTDNYANLILDEADRTVADNADAIRALAIATKTDNIAGVVYKGSTLELKSETAIYYNFTVTDSDITKYAVDGAEIVSLEGNILSVKVSGIVAANLAAERIVTVTYEGETITLTSNVMAYAKAQVNSSNPTVSIDLMNSLYEYYAAALEYSNNPNG